MPSHTTSRTHRYGAALASVFAFAVVSVAIAQTPPPPERPAPPAPPRSGEGAPDPSPLVDRIMSADKDGDGKVSKSELPPELADRIFDRADANHDGFLDRPELMAFAQGQGAGGPPGEGRGRGEGRGQRGPQQNFEGAMKQADRALKALNKSALDSSTHDADLELVQSLESGLIATKSQISTVPMSPKAKAKFGNDQVAYQTAFRRELLKAITGAIALETALLDGKSDQAKKIIAQLADEKENGHDLYQPEEGKKGEEAPGGAPKPPTGR